MTRQNILEAAAQVFRQKGFHGASMNDIAGAVSLQKASQHVRGHGMGAGTYTCAVAQGQPTNRARWFIYLGRIY